MSETVTADIEYDPNIPETWAVRGDVNGWNNGTRVYIQTPPSEVPDVVDNFIEEETENLTVEVFSWGEVNVYCEGNDPSSTTGHDLRREYEADSDEVPLWWITELLVDEGYIEDEQYGVPESVPEGSDIGFESVDTDTVSVTDDVKEIAWEAYKQAWNSVDSMDSLTKLEERTARRKFDNWWHQNYADE